MADLLAYPAVAFALLVLAGFYLSWRATRLDRLHTRVETARAALDAALLRRGAVALELAASGLLDPAASLLLADAAHHARSASQADRQRAESDLSQALRAVLTPSGDGTRAEPVERSAPGAAELVEEIGVAARGVVIAHRFHGEAVRLTRAARRRPLCRWLRLAGTAPLPTCLDIDDTPPALD